MPSSSVILVDSALLRQKFNDGRFYERVMDGDLREDLLAERHLTRRQAGRAGQRYCTFSQSVAYYDVAGRKLAIVHQYFRNNQLGGSGRPYPKWLRLGNETFALLPVIP